MDAKLKWWERSAQARTKHGKGSDDKPPAATEESGAAAGAGQEVRPGAVAVRGPGRREDDDDVSTVRVGGRGRTHDDTNDAETTEAPPFHVDSYAVNEGPTDEEIRQRILACTAHAEPVPDAKGGRTSRQRRWGTALVILIVVAVAAAIAVGIAVPLSQRQSQATGAPPDDDVLASFTYLEWQSSGGFAYSVRAETKRSPNGRPPETSGLLEMVYCRVIKCLENDENCLTGGLYSPGCCFGAECAANESKCGSFCPPSPESCYQIDPDNTTCLQPECYACHQINGQDTYVIKNTAYAIDCLEVGTAIRPGNGQTYKWAIFCGPVIAGPVVEENRDLGEYQRGAFRVGANYSDDDGGLQTGPVPCQFIALADCGCGPSDVYTFGLPDPTGPCLPEGDCPFLCEDVGPQYARNLCHNFPGNISWFLSGFYEDAMAPEYTLEIYIKGLDDQG